MFRPSQVATRGPGTYGRMCRRRSALVQGGEVAAMHSHPGYVAMLSQQIGHQITRSWND